MLGAAGGWPGVGVKVAVGGIGVGVGGTGVFVTVGGVDIGVTVFTGVGVVGVSWPCL